MTPQQENVTGDRQLPKMSAPVGATPLGDDGTGAGQPPGLTGAVFELDDWQRRVLVAHGINADLVQQLLNTCPGP